eukprot:4778088-Alexandrium_andersonii.AAC.1
MSASLVGSEMCIRDRTLHRLNCWLLNSELQCSRGETETAATPNWTPQGACLLYTSDAADDM